MPLSLRNTSPLIFSSQFQQSCHHRPTIKGCLVFKQVPNEQNASLTQKLNALEIDVAVKDCHCDKTPKPDGFLLRVLKKAGTL